MQQTNYFHTRFTARSLEREGRPRNGNTAAEPRRGHEPPVSQAAVTDRNADREPFARASRAKSRDDFILACHFYGCGRNHAAILWSAAAADAQRLPAMSASGTYHFGIYTLRPAGEADLARAVQWTAADVFHAGRTRPEFWIEQSVNRDSYVLEDREGAVFFFKLHRLAIHAVELHCQFPPLDDIAEEPSETVQYERERVRHALQRGFEWLEGALKISKVRDVYFDTTNGALRNFAVRRLGFQAKDDSQRLEKHMGGS
jgi:hypothetical protein